MSKTDAVLGLSLGSSYCVVAVHTGTRPDVVVNEMGERATPIVVGFSDGVGAPLFGETAKQTSIRYPLATVAHIVPLLTPSIVARNALPPYADVAMAADEGGEDRTVATVHGAGDDGDATFPLADVLVKFLSFVKTTIVERSFGENTQPTVAVVAVPRYADQAAVRRAVEGAGMAKSVSVLYDDTAALVAHGLLNVPGESAFSTAVVSIGAECTSISLFVIESGTAVLLANTVEWGHAGSAIDALIAIGCAQAFQKQHRGIDPTTNVRAMRRLRVACESARRTLSNSNVATVAVESLAEGIDCSVQWSRSRLATVVRQELQLPSLLAAQLENTLASAGDKASISPMRSVILTGGLCTSPVVQQVIQEVFRDVLARSGHTAVDFVSQAATDELPAVGACTHAMQLSGAGMTGGCVEALPVLVSDVYLFVGHSAPTIESDGTLSAAPSDVVPLAARGSLLPLDVTINVGEQTPKNGNALLLFLRAEEKKDSYSVVAHVSVPWEELPKPGVPLRFDERGVWHGGEMSRKDLFLTSWL